MFTISSYYIYVLKNQAMYIIRQENTKNNEEKLILEIVYIFPDFPVKREQNAQNRIR